MGAKNSNSWKYHNNQHLIHTTPAHQLMFLQQKGFNLKPLIPIKYEYSTHYIAF